MKGEAGKSERLFRAAISAFCSLTRPTRREIAQLEDLALPLFDMVSVEGRRFAAAALSECDYAPRALVQRLCNQPVDIAAPLLIRSRLVKDVDLIALIGRHGLPHARAIARRPKLNPAIADLVRALDNPKLVRLPVKDSQRKSEQAATPVPTEVTETQPEQLPGILADDTRRRLRSMMVPSQHDAESAGDEVPGPYARLRDTALIGNSAFFQTALADAIGIDFRAARSIAETADHSILLAALRSLDLSEERAFLIACALFPGRFAHPQAIRLFLHSYRLLHPGTARERIKTWQAKAVSASVSKARDGAAKHPVGQEGARLKAS